MSEISNGRLGLYGAEDPKCNRVMTLAFKGLSLVYGQHLSLLSVTGVGGCRKKQITIAINKYLSGLHSWYTSYWQSYGKAQAPHVSVRCGLLWICCTDRTSGV